MPHIPVQRRFDNHEDEWRFRIQRNVNGVWIDVQGLNNGDAVEVECSARILVDIMSEAMQFFTQLCVCFIVAFVLFLLLDALQDSRYR